VQCSVPAGPQKANFHSRLAGSKKPMKPANPANDQDVAGRRNQKGYEMKYQIQWLALVFVLVAGVAGSLGCATMAAMDAVQQSDSSVHYRAVLADEIVAFGRPNAALTKELGQEHVVAFIGLKNTYLLNQGGEELERISQLKLDGNRLTVHAKDWEGSRLYLKDKQVWGCLVLTYGDTKSISKEEQAELKKSGFSIVPEKGTKNIYRKEINIEGLIYPAIKLSDEQMANLTRHRAFTLYDPGSAKPPVMGKILKSPLIVVGVVTDIALTPVYVGFVTIGLIGSTIGK
jgi:hypothetical protein